MRTLRNAKNSATVEKKRLPRILYYVKEKAYMLDLFTRGKPCEKLLRPDYSKYNLIQKLD
jgi:hypothetical protein